MGAKRTTVTLTNLCKQPLTTPHVHRPLKASNVLICCSTTHSQVFECPSSSFAASSLSQATWTCLLPLPSPFARRLLKASNAVLVASSPRFPLIVEMADTERTMLVYAHDGDIWTANNTDLLALLPSRPHNTDWARILSHHALPSQLAHWGVPLLALFDLSSALGGRHPWPVR